MNPLLRFNASRREAMDDIAHVTPDKFQKRDIVIPNQDNQEKIISSPKDTPKQNGYDFLQKILTQNGIANTPKNDKMTN